MSPMPQESLGWLLITLILTATLLVCGWIIATWNRKNK